MTTTTKVPSLNSVFCKLPFAAGGGYFCRPVSENLARRAAVKPEDAFVLGAAEN